MKPSTGICLAAVCSMSLCQSAFAWGGTTEGTINAGGALAYSSSSEVGSEFDFEGHGGYYFYDAFLAGGSVSVLKNDAVTTFDVSALCKYHFLDTFLADSEGRPYAFSPYVGARLGLARGKNDFESHTGVLAAARLGMDLFLTQNVALDVMADFAACTSEVYPDKAELKKSAVTVKVGLDFNF
ncbi:MAG: outer membrane beta-barrel protein [Kiritimatiellae bacterium]|nr:outer membrane beta-barrel protein [Kiritimatiellia bacterium]